MEVNCEVKKVSIEVIGDKGINSYHIYYYHHLCHHLFH